MKQSTAHQSTAAQSTGSQSTASQSTGHQSSGHQNTVVENYCTTIITSPTPSADEVMCSFFAQQATLPVTYKEDLA